MKKKLLAVLLASTMVFSLAGCGSTGEAKTEEPAVAEETAEETTEETATEEAATEETAEETTGKKWVIATDTAFKPFEYTDDAGEFVGIDVDILAAIAKDQGFEY